MGVVASVTSCFAFNLVSGASRLLPAVLHILNNHRRSCWDGMGVVDPLFFRHDCSPIHGGTCIVHAVSRPPELPSNLDRSRTSAGLYYFAAKLAPSEYAALASWITGWANVTGQITLVCSIDFTWQVLSATFP